MSTFWKVENLSLFLQLTAQKRRRQVEEDGPDGDLRSSLPWHGNHLVLWDPSLCPHRPQHPPKCVHLHWHSQHVSGKLLLKRTKLLRPFLVRVSGSLPSLCASGMYTQWCPDRPEVSTPPSDLFPGRCQVRYSPSNHQLCTLCNCLFHRRGKSDSGTICSREAGESKKRDEHRHKRDQPQQRCPWGSPDVHHQMTLSLLRITNFYQHLPSVSLESLCDGKYIFHKDIIKWSASSYLSARAVGVGWIYPITAGCPAPAAAWCPCPTTWTLACQCWWAMWKFCSNFFFFFSFHDLRQTSGKWAVPSYKTSAT